MSAISLIHHIAAWPLKHRVQFQSTIMSIHISVISMATMQQSESINGIMASHFQKAKKGMNGVGHESVHLQLPLCNRRDHSRHLSCQVLFQLSNDEDLMYCGVFNEPCCRKHMAVPVTALLLVCLATLNCILVVVVVVNKRKYMIIHHF